MIDVARISTWLPQARWFAGKGAALSRLAVGDEAWIPGTDVCLAMLDVATADATDRYVAPLANDADAAFDAGFAAWLVDAIQGGATLAAGGGLRGLADRAAAVDGTFRVTSPAGGPTVIQAELPCGEVRS